MKKCTRSWLNWLLVSYCSFLAFLQAKPDVVPLKNRSVTRLAKHSLGKRWWHVMSWVINHHFLSLSFFLSNLLKVYKEKIMDTKVNQVAFFSSTTTWSTREGYVYRSLINVSICFGDLPSEIGEGVLMSPDWENIFPLVSARNLVNGYSDHNPLLLIPVNLLC